VETTSLKWSPQLGGGGRGQDLVARKSMIDVTGFVARKSMVEVAGFVARKSMVEGFKPGISMLEVLGMQIFVVQPMAVCQFSLHSSLSCPDFLWRALP